MGKDVLLKSKPDFGQKAGDTFMLDSGYIGGNSFTIVKHLFRGVKREYGASLHRDSGECPLNDERVSQKDLGYSQDNNMPDRQHTQRKV